MLEEADESVSEEGTIGPDGEDGEHDEENGDNDDAEWHGEGSGSWQPGQGVFVDHAAIMDIIVNHLSYPGMSPAFDSTMRVAQDLTQTDELVQSTAMEWVLTFLEFAQTTVVAFMPRIVPAILPNLASNSYVDDRISHAIYTG